MNGYLGRTAAFELYTPGEAVSSLLNAPSAPLPAAIRQALGSELGEYSEYLAACRTVSLGLTSLEEAATLLQPTTNNR